MTGMNNPFVSNKLDHTSSVPPGDVPELHAPVLDQCKSALAGSRISGQSTSVMVIGEAGAGKSHMIAQFRQQLANDPGAVLAAIRLGGATSGNLWRHVRRQLVSELLNTYSDPQHGENGLLRILKNRFPRWLTSSGSGSFLLDWVLQRPDAGASLNSPLKKST